MDTEKEIAQMEVRVGANENRIANLPCAMMAKKVESIKVITARVETKLDTVCKNQSNHLHHHWMITCGAILAIISTSLGILATALAFIMKFGQK
jgi:hypothetical protein